MIDYKAHRKAAEKRARRRALRDGWEDTKVLYFWAIGLGLVYALVIAF